ncbi:MAG: iron ABC transporter substrate-binding protein [Dehalococcoidia bacterium]
MKRLRILAAAGVALLTLAAAAACGGDDRSTLTVYSGRSESLVGPLLERYADETGARVEVRYASTAELASTILEEGGNSPADVYFAQDAGALGALAKERRLVALPQSILDLVDARFRSDDGRWVGISARARVVAYNTNNVDPADLPASILDFTDPKWKGRIGWAPTNGSFQAFVTALRLTQGDAGARAWLEGIEANDPVAFDGNLPALVAVASGELDVAFINHYYLYQLRSETDGNVDAANYFLPGGDAGALVNVAGAGILDSADSSEEAERFIEWLLTDESQQYFASETHEYPIVDGVPAEAELVALRDIQTPAIDLSDLDDLEGTLELLRDTGVIP